jgi:hypothetical protein
MIRIVFTAGIFERKKMSGRGSVRLLPENFSGICTVFRQAKYFQLPVSGTEPCHKNIFNQRTISPRPGK